MDAAGWDARYAEKEFVWSAGPNQFVQEQVTTHLADVRPGRAVDLAGGEGRNAVWLAERGWATELVEFSAVAISKAERLAGERGVRIATTLADVTAFPPLEPADLVLSCYLQLTGEPLRRALGHAASLVTPGGTILIIAHDRENLTNGYAGPQDPDALPTVEEVLAAIDGVGLEVEEAGQVFREVATDDGPRRAIDLLVRATRSNETTSAQPSRPAA